jgi:hypothetical protein
MSAEQFRDALGSLTGVWFNEPAAQFDLRPAHLMQGATPV